MFAPRLKIGTFYESICNNRKLLQKQGRSFRELENIIKSHGFIVAFEKLSEKTLKLMLELEEIQVLGLLNNLEKHIELTSSKIMESKPEKTCNVHLHLNFK